MKLTRKFVWTPRGNHGGWKPEGAPNFDPGLPVHVAHDTLEHFSKDESFHGELMAFGSIVYGRAYTDDSGDMLRVAADDLSGFLEAQDFRVKKAVTRWDRPLKDEKAEHMVQMLVQMTFIKLAVFHGIPGPTAKAATQQCLPWIRLGYLLADRRWKGDHNALDDTFQKLYHKVGFDHDMRFPHRGERLTVEVDTETKAIKLQRETA